MHFLVMVSVIIFANRDEPNYHNAGDYNVPYGGVPAHHNTWPHPDVQQMQASQQDARQQQRCEMENYFDFICDICVIYLEFVVFKGHCQEGET